MRFVFASFVFGSLFVLGCSAPPAAFCVDTSMAAFCGRDARGNEYRPVCSSDGDAGAEPVGATCTRGLLDPCPDGTEPRCEPVP